MARPFTKYYPDPEVPITEEHKNLLEQWDLWDDAERRGVKVAQDGAVDGSGDQGESLGPAESETGSVGASTASEEGGRNLDELEYSDWTAAELRDELGNRELSTSGNKREMIARLEEDDKENS